jgi:hypothetical protein
LALGTGIVTGLLSWRERSALNEQCGASLCDPALRGRSERGRLLANVSTVAFVTAASGLVSGGLILGLVPTGHGSRADGAQLTVATGF